MLRSWISFGAALGVGFTLACVVDLPEDGQYRCATDADCGGDGYQCAPSVDGGVRACCKPSGAETCDSKDNDCNGQVDDVAAVPCYSGSDPSRIGIGVCRRGQQGCTGGCVGEVVPAGEQCNGLDDDCDTMVDEDFDLLNNPVRCGSCTNSCSLGQICFNGGCRLPSETVCNDDLDNDQDGPQDCADPDCNNQSCDAGCTCRALRPTEVACLDVADNDRDNLVDCADSDCDGGSCGTGCQCTAGSFTENICNDDLDNDLDSTPDCGDLDCNNRSCDAGCVCRSLRPAEANCLQNPLSGDEDNDGQANCADSDCLGLVCRVSPMRTCRSNGNCQ